MKNYSVVMKNIIQFIQQVNRFQMLFPIQVKSYTVSVYFSAHGNVHSFTGFFYIEDKHYIRLFNYSVWLTGKQFFRPVLLFSDCLRYTVFQTLVTVYFIWQLNFFQIKVTTQLVQQVYSIPDTQFSSLFLLFSSWW